MTACAISELSKYTHKIVKFRLSPFFAFLFLGVFSLESCARIYIFIEKVLLKTEEDQWVTKVAHKSKEAQKLVEVASEFGCDFGMHVQEAKMKGNYSYLLEISLNFLKVNKGI